MLDGVAMMPARRRAMATARAAAAAAASAGRLIGWMSVKACRWNGGLHHHSRRGNGHGLTQPLPTLDLNPQRVNADVLVPRGGGGRGGS